MCVHVCVMLLMMVVVVVMMPLQPPASSSHKDEMLQLVVLMLLVPRLLLIHSARTALICLPSPFFLSSPPLLLSPLLPLARTSHAVLCSARWGSYCSRAPLFFFFICQTSSLVPAAPSFSHPIAVATSCISEAQKEMRAPEPPEYLQICLASSL